MVTNEDCEEIRVEYADYGYRGIDHSYRFGISPKYYDEIGSGRKRQSKGSDDVKVVLNSDEAKKALASINLVSRGPSAEVLLQIDDSGTYLRCRNSVVSGRVKLNPSESTASSVSMVAFQSHRASQILKASTQDKIIFSSKDSRKVTIKDGKGRFNLSSKQHVVDGFKSLFPNYGNANFVSIPAKTLKRMFRIAKRSVGKKAATDAFDISGIRVEIDAKGNGIHFVSTNNIGVCHAHYKSIDRIHPDAHSQTIVSSDVAICVGAFSDDEIVSMAISGAHLIIRSDRVQMNCTTIQSRYPNWRKILDAGRETPYQFTLDKKEVSQGIKQASVVRSPERTGVLFEFEEAGISMSMESSVGGSSRVFVPYLEGDKQSKVLPRPAALRLDGKILADFLSRIKDESVTLQVGGPKSLAVWTGQDTVFASAGMSS